MKKMMPYLQRLSAALRWIVCIILFVFALNLKNPYLLWGREFLPPAIAAFCVINGSSTLHTIKSAKLPKKSAYLSLLLTAITLAATLVNEGRFQMQKHHVLNQDTVIARQLGKHLLIGYKNVDEITALAERGMITGVFISRRNINGKSAAEIAAEIKHLQKLRANNGLPPLFIATDQEGGIVSRLSPPLSKQPPLAEVISGKTLEEARIAAKDYGEKQGKELATLGINVNFSPVVDLQNDTEANPLDFHSLINQRAISADKNIVAEIALSYSLGLEKHGVLPTIKHFPGMGRVTEDTHHFGATSTTPEQALETTDWIPFRHVLQHSRALMMLAHVVLSSVDDKHPVSHSKKVVQDIIRKEWRFKGLLITDDLTMNAIYGGKHGLCEAAVQALNAGVDLLLLSYDHEKYYEAMYCLLKAHGDGKLDLQMLSKSNVRMAKEKNAFL